MDNFKTMNLRTTGEMKNAENTNKNLHFPQSVAKKFLKNLIEKSKIL